MNLHVHIDYGTRLATRALPGTTQLHRLEENLAGADIELDSSDMQAIHQALADLQVVGERYPASRAALVNR